MPRLSLASPLREAHDDLRMAVAEHDRILAMTSHLPHLLAFALVDNAQQRARRAVREETSSIPTALNHVIPFAP